jgi:hypothetical protein
MVLFLQIFIISALVLKNTIITSTVFSNALNVLPSYNASLTFTTVHKLCMSQATEVLSVVMLLFACDQ